MQGAMGMDTSDATGGRMYISEESFQRIGRISIPNPPYTGQNATTSIAHVVVPTGDVGGGGSGHRLGGSIVVDGRLIVSYFGYYDAAVDQSESHTSVALTLTGGFSADQATVGANCRPYAGYMMHVPSEWQALLGGPHLWGQCRLARVGDGGSSNGPSFVVGDLSGVGSGGPAIVSGTVCTFYDDDTTHALVSGYLNEGSSSTLFCGEDHMAGGGIIPGTRTLIMLGQHCTGELQYLGEGEGTDPCTGFGGFSQYPYQYQYWMFDLLDLIAARDSEMELWEVRPYAYGALPGVTPGNCNRSQNGSACYDPVRNRLYLTDYFGGQVHVWQCADF